MATENFQIDKTDWFEITNVSLSFSVQVRSLDGFDGEFALSPTKPETGFSGFIGDSGETFFITLDNGDKLWARAITEPVNIIKEEV